MWHHAELVLPAKVVAHQPSIRRVEADPVHLHIHFAHFATGRVPARGHLLNDIKSMLYGTVSAVTDRL